MEQKQYKPRQDVYTKARGGWSTLLSIFCAKCKRNNFLYQKDGPGELKRMYLDKVIAPESFAKKLSTHAKITDVDNLSCTNCGHLMATPMIYEKENRLAYKVVQGGMIEQINLNGWFPAPLDNIFLQLFKGIVAKLRSLQ